MTKPSTTDILFLRAFAELQINDEDLPPLPLVGKRIGRTSLATIHKHTQRLCEWGLLVQTQARRYQVSYEGFNYLATGNLPKERNSHYVAITRFP